jgi:hypothetical protein
VAWTFISQGFIVITIYTNRTFAIAIFAIGAPYLSSIECFALNFVNSVPTLSWYVALLFGHHIYTGIQKLLLSTPVSLNNIAAAPYCKRKPAVFGRVKLKK